MKNKSIGTNGMAKVGLWIAGGLIASWSAVGCGGSTSTSDVVTCAPGTVRQGNLCVADGSPGSGGSGPTCTDQIKNGSETGIDCGGESCPACADSCQNGPCQACAGNAPCPAGQVCVGGLCEPDSGGMGGAGGMGAGGMGAGGMGAGGMGTGGMGTGGMGTGGMGAGGAVAVCGDGVKNGTETDVDCGGSCAKKCNNLQFCLGAADCLSSVCTAGTCSIPTCVDGVKNGAETSKDCGGSCSPCANGKPCAIATDCSSGFCANQICQAPPLGACTIYGGFGLEVLNTVNLEVDCHAACDGQAQPHPNRECSWAGTIFLPHALGVCFITGGAGATLYAENLPMKDTCSQECTKQTIDLIHPNARCKWAQYLLQEHAAGVCLIKDGANVLSQTLDPSKANCITLCAVGRNTFPAATCTWAEDIL